MFKKQCSKAFKQCSKRLVANSRVQCGLRSRTGAVWHLVLSTGGQTQDDYLRLFTTICDYLRLFTTIYLRLFTTIHLRLLTTIYDYLFTTIYDYLRLFTNIYDYLRLFIYDYLRLFTTKLFQWCSPELTHKGGGGRDNYPKSLKTLNHHS